MTRDPERALSAGDQAVPVQRLTAIGLPPRSVGWVPDQAAVVVEPDPVVREPGLFDPSAAPQTASPRLEAARDAAAARLPEWIAAPVERMSGRRFGAVVVGLLGVVIAIAVGIHHHRSQTTFSSYSAPADDAPSASPAGAVDDGSSIVVDVAGKVRHSGLVTLPVGARVADAIKAAGGAVRQRDLDEVDLAQRVTDGELLTVGPRHGRHASGASSKLVDLSTASMTKLETLPGVGPVTAQKIVDWRTAHGGFTSVSELQQVSGIGPAHYAELSPLVAP